MALLLTSLTQVSSPALPPPAREFRGVWVATVDNIDWPSKRDLTTEQQKVELEAILDKCQELNLNAVILQVRPSCDALYPSTLEPWSEFLTGKQGRSTNPAWDPLAFAVQEAHYRGLELHAWFNPYRAKHPAMKGDLAPSHIANTNPDVVKTYGKYLWLDPGEPIVQKRSLDVMLDVVKRYDVDGVHMDDYFYPYPVKDAKGRNVPFPDDRSYTTYRTDGGKLSRDDWRRKNVDDFIQALYQGVKKQKPWVKVGISPFGIYRPGQPEGIKAGIDQYAELFADCKKWLREGWCDYFTPQLYWPIKQTAQSYPKLLDWWITQNVKKRLIWPGNFTGQIGEKQANWPVQEVLDQIEITRKAKGATGNVHFSMKSLLQNWKGIGEALVKGPYKDKALVPSIRPGETWNGAVRLEHVNTMHGEIMRSAKSAREKETRSVVFWTKYRGLGWKVDSIVPYIVEDEGGEAVIFLPAKVQEGLQAIAAAPIDRFGRQGKVATLELGPR